MVAAIIGRFTKRSVTFKEAPRVERNIVLTSLLAVFISMPVKIKAF